MSRWPKDNQAALKRFYGDPAKNEVAPQLVRVVPPFQLFYGGKPLKSVSFHRKAGPALLAAFNKIWEYYDYDQTLLDSLGVSATAGTYNHRKIRGSRKWSNHAFGAAIDLDPDRNGFGTGEGTMPKPVVAAFKSEGARWGGDYRGRTDPMHFEFCDGGDPVRTFEGWLEHYGEETKQIAAIAEPEIEPEMDYGQIAVSAASRRPKTVVTVDQKTPVKSSTIWSSAAAGLSAVGATLMSALSDWRVLSVLLTGIVLLALLWIVRERLRMPDIVRKK